MPNKRRIFIDPASRSSGWAQFIGPKFEKAWTFELKDKDPFVRLHQLSSLVHNFVVDGSVQEAHIETMNYGVHYACIWSVGVIGATLARKDIKVEQDIPVKAWQKDANWKETQYLWETIHSPWPWASEDEWAAYNMGVWWLKKHKIIA